MWLSCWIVPYLQLSIKQNYLLRIDYIKFETYKRQLTVKMICCLSHTFSNNLIFFSFFFLHLMTDETENHLLMRNKWLRSWQTWKVFLRRELWDVGFSFFSFVLTHLKRNSLFVLKNWHRLLKFHIWINNNKATYLYPDVSYYSR